MILDYYIEEKYLKDIFNIFDNLYLKNRSNQYYVQMAVAWAISICLVKFYDETLKYLEKSKIDIQAKKNMRNLVNKQSIKERRNFIDVMEYGERIKNRRETILSGKEDLRDVNDEKVETSKVNIKSTKDM